MPLHSKSRRVVSAAGSSGVAARHRFGDEERDGSPLDPQSFSIPQPARAPRFAAMPLPAGAPSQFDATATLRRRRRHAPAASDTACDPRVRVIVDHGSGNREVVRRRSNRHYRGSIINEPDQPSRRRSSMSTAHRHGGARATASWHVEPFSNLVPGSPRDCVAIAATTSSGSSGHCSNDFVDLTQTHRRRRQGRKAL